MDSRRPSHLVIEAVASEAGMSPTELSPPLYDVLDGDALDALFEGTPDDASVEIEFEYQGYEVTVAGADPAEVTVRVTPTPAAG